MADVDDDIDVVRVDPADVACALHETQFFLNIMIKLVALFSPRDIISFGGLAIRKSDHLIEAEGL